MSAAEPPPLLQQQLQQQQLQQQPIQQIQQLHQPLLPHDPGAGGDGGRAFLPTPPPQQPLPAAVLQPGPSSSSAHHLQLQQQQQSVFPRPAEFLPQQQLVYPQLQQQQALLQPLQSPAPAVGSAGRGGSRGATAGSSSSNCSVPLQRAAAAAGAPANPSGTSGCNQIQVEPRHVLQLLRQLVDENPESFKRFQVRPDMPPRAVHQLLRELEEARLIKQQEVLRRAHALALQQQQQHREGASGGVSPSSSSVCATPPLGGGAAAERRHPQQEGGRRSRGQQQQQQQGQPVTGEAAESEKRKKKKKKAVFPEGPGGWGPEAKKTSSNAAAAAAATAAPAPSAVALSHTGQTALKSPADVSRALKLLPTLSQDKQAELLVGLLATPDGLTLVQELKDAGRLSSALVQQALRKYREQQHQQKQLLASSSSAGGRPREGADHGKNEGDAEASLAGTSGGRDNAVWRGKSEGRKEAGSSSCPPATQGTEPGSLGAEQKRPPFVKALHAWTCREDAWAAAATAAAAGVGCLPAAAARVCAPAGAAGLTAAGEAAAAVAASVGGADAAGGDFGWRDGAIGSGNLQKAASISSSWLDEAAGADGRGGPEFLLPSVYYVERTGGVVATPSYADESSGDAFFPAGTSTGAAGGPFRHRDDGRYVSGSDSLEAATGRRAEAAAVTHSSSVLSLRRLQDVAGVGKGRWPTAATQEWGQWQHQVQRFQQQQQHLFLSGVQQRVLQGSADSSALLHPSSRCSRLPAAALASQWTTCKPLAMGDGAGGAERADLARDTAAAADLRATGPQMQTNAGAAASVDSSSRGGRGERGLSSAPLYSSSNMNAWNTSAAGPQGAATNTARVDPAALLFFGRGVSSVTDDSPVPAAAPATSEKQSGLPPRRQLSKLDTYIQRLVELTMRRLGAAYGGRLYLTDEAEIRSILKQALKDRLRAMAPTLCALAEYRAERHLQRLVAAAEAEQRSLGEEREEGGERSTLLGGSNTGSRGPRGSLQQQFYAAASAMRDSAGEELLEGEAHAQQASGSRKRSHADVWQSPAAADGDAADGALAAADDLLRAHRQGPGAGGDALLPRRREKLSSKSPLQRLAVYQRFDELHALFMQRESDKLLVEHLRKLQEQQRKGKASRAKNKGVLATDSSVQSAPFIRNSDDAREGQDPGGTYPAGSAVSARGAANEAAAAAVFAYLEKQAVLLNGSSISGEADPQLALLSAEIQLELRQRQLAEIAEEKAIEFAKVAHSQRLLLLKATALDFRTFLHTKTAAAFFPMRFRERLLQYVEAVHFDLQSPPPRIPRSLLPVASPPQSAAEVAAAAVAARSAVAALKAAILPGGRPLADKPGPTSSSSSTLAARSGASSAALSRTGGSAKSSATLAAAVAADGWPRSPDTAAPPVLEGTKVLETAAGAAPKEARATVASGASLPSPTTTQGKAAATQLTSASGSSLSQVSGSGAGDGGGTAAGFVAADGGSISVVTGKKSGMSKVAKTRVRKKVSSSVVGAGKGTDTWLPPREGGGDVAGGKVLRNVETPPGIRRGSGVRGKSGGREMVSETGASGNGRSAHHSVNSLSSVGSAEGGGRRNQVSETDAVSLHVASSASAMVDNGQLLRRQEARTAVFPSRGESLAELFGIPTVKVSDVATASPQEADESTGLHLKPDSSASGSRQGSGGSVLNTTSSGSRRGVSTSGYGEVRQTQQTEAGVGYATAGTTHWEGGVLAGNVAATADTLIRQQPQQILHHQQLTEHFQKSGQLVQQDDGSSVTGNVYTNEQLGGFAPAADGLPSAFGIVSAAGCSSADVVIPELEGEGEEDCL